LTGTLPTGGYYLVQLAAGASGGALPAPDAVGSTDLNFFAGKVVLARGVDALMCNGGSSPCDSGTMARIVDLVGYGTADFFEGSGAAQGAWTNLGLVRAGDGCTDTNDNLADFAAMAPAPRNQASPGVTCAPPPPPPPPPPCVPTHTIAQVQGNASTSPWSGANVAFGGVVTARFASATLNGFFLQMPIGDGDASTSDGIFVSSGPAPAPLEAMPGNEVCVEGQVAELVPSGDLSARPVTTLLASRVALVGTGRPLPAPVTLTAADTPAGSLVDGLERLEGMRVRVASLGVVSPTTGGVFYGVVAGVPRPFREPGIDVHDGRPFDAPDTVPLFDANLERLRVDTGALGLTSIDVATGTVVSELVGPLHYSERTYTILASQTPAVTPGPASAATSALPVPRSTEFTTATLNADRLFDTTDSPDHDDIVVTSAALAARLSKLSRQIRTVLQTPDLLAVQDVETLEVLQALAARVNADAVAAGQPDPRYEAHLIDGFDATGLDVGVLVRTARVTVALVTQEGADATFVDPFWGTTDPLFERPPLVVRATVALSSGPVPVTAIVAHLTRAAGMANPYTGTHTRVQRAAQAEFIAGLVQQRQLAAAAEPLMVLGDLDAPAFTDGYVDVAGALAGSPADAAVVSTTTADLVEPNLADALADVPAASRYTSAAHGTAQQLDHVLVNAAAADLQSRAYIAHVNADFPEAWATDASRAERAASTDAAVVYFEVAAAAPEPPPTAPQEVTSLVRVRVRTWRPFGPHRGLAHALVEVTNVSRKNLSGPFVLGVYGLPNGAMVLNATGTIASMPAVRVPWAPKLRPGRSFLAWVVLNGMPYSANPKVRVFVVPAK
jgi:predicted extracellular nuclease